MKCVNCGAELRVGSVYCAACGREAQIVSDSNVLEEELLEEILKDERRPKEKISQKAKSLKSKASQGKVKKSGGEKSGGSGAGKKEAHKKSYKSLILLMTCVVVLAALSLILIPEIIRQRNYNSLDYQMESGQQNLNAAEYEKALENFQRVLELDADQITARYELAKLYQLVDKPESAIEQLRQIISKYPEEKRAYEMLIDLYKEQKAYEAIVKLRESVTKSEILTLFDEFLVQQPQFLLEPGTYDDWISIALSAEDGNEILYTTDSSDPSRNGTVYQEAISMEAEGTLKLKAVARNQYGLFSEPLEGSFTVKYEKPRMPSATPNGGNFQSPTTVTLKGSEGSHMYYTWDGTTPTSDSAEYSEPIPVPEGNCILSVILVDKHGNFSDVLKCNFRYYPQS